MIVHCLNKGTEGDLRSGGRIIGKYVVDLIYAPITRPLTWEISPCSDIGAKL
jgi:hypothetical protein